MSRRPYYKRYPSDWLAGVMVLSAEQRGVYDTIIDLLYDRGRPIKDDPKELARICGCSSPRHFRTVRDRLVELGKIARVDGTITNARFERERAKDGGDSGEKHPEKSQESGRSERTDLFNNNDLGPPIPESRVQKPESKSQRAREVPIDPAWQPNENDAAYAAERGFDQRQIAELRESFVDHHLKKGTEWVDWSAAWRTWVRNEVKFNQQRQRGNHEANRPGAAAGTGFAAFSAQLRARGAGGQS